MGFIVGFSTRFETFVRSRLCRGCKTSGIGSLAVFHGHCWILLGSIDWDSTKEHPAVSRVAYRCHIFWVQHVDPQRWVVFHVDHLQRLWYVFCRSWDGWVTFGSPGSMSSGMQRLDETDLENQRDPPKLLLDFRTVDLQWLVSPSIFVTWVHWQIFWQDWSFLKFIRTCLHHRWFFSGHHTMFQCWIAWMLFWHVFLYGSQFEISNPSWLAQLAHIFLAGPTSCCQSKFPCQWWIVKW